MNHPIRLIVSAVVWAIIEIVDAALLSFNIPWWVSGLLALVLVYGGVFIYTESDGELDF